MELWKLNNLFKIFLLSFIIAFLASVFLLRDLLVSRYLIIALIVGISVYIVFGALPLLKRRAAQLRQHGERAGFSRTSMIGILVIVILFVAAFIIVRDRASPTQGYQLVSSQFFVLPNGTVFDMRPTAPANECAWLESMNVTTQQKARDQGLPDCDFAWPHINLSQPTVFLEFENSTEFVYVINASMDPAPSSIGTVVLCFTIPAQSFQCWVPPARVSHLR